MDEATAQAWMSAMNSVNTAAGTIAQSNLNYTTRDWNEKIMNMQRQWAIEDRDYANSYNSPTGVMARAKAAGINPMYAATNGNVITASSPVRSADAQSWHPQNPVPSGSNSGDIMSMMNLKLMEAQLENVKSQNANINADTQLKLKNSQNVDVRTQSMSLDLNTKTLLQSTTIGQEIARLSGLQEDIDVKKQHALSLWETANKTSYEMTFMHDENARREAMNAANIGQAVERVLLMKKQEALAEAATKHTRVDVDRLSEAINNLQKDGKLKDWIIELNKSNLQPGDPVFFRLMDGILKLVIQ